MRDVSFSQSGFRNPCLPVFESLNQWASRSSYVLFSFSYTTHQLVLQQIWKQIGWCGTFPSALLCLPWSSTGPSSFLLLSMSHLNDSPSSGHSLESFISSMSSLSSESLSLGHLNPPSPSYHNWSESSLPKKHQFCFLLVMLWSQASSLPSCRWACLSSFPESIQIQPQCLSHETRVMTAKWMAPREYMALVKGANLCGPQFPHYTRKQKFCSGILGYGCVVMDEVLKWVVSGFLQILQSQPRF